MCCPSLRDKVWSPYVAGVFIGLLQIPAFLLIDTSLGTSSSYVSVAGAVASVFDPAIQEFDYLAKHISASPKNWWQVAMVVGIALGAFLSMKLSGAGRKPISPIWKRALCDGCTPKSRYRMAFVAGFIMLMGARIADGCTSGHGLSGSSQLGIGSLIAVAAMFVGAILTAKLFLRKI